MGGAANARWFARLVLITVVVVGLLYGCNALLRPVMTRYAGLMVTGTCVSNVQFLLRSCALYADDYDSRFPIAQAWMDRTQPYTKPRWLTCPAVAGTPGAYGYALNAAVGGKDRHRLPASATTPMIYDSQRLERSAVDHADSLPKPGRHASPLKGGPAPRGNVAGYADGSGRFVADGLHP